MSLALGLTLAGCAPAEVRQYRVAKLARPAGIQAGTGSDADPGAPLSYSLPAGWEKQPASAMRLASFSIKGGGDFSVVSLPAGDLLSNINRWRGQVGLPPLQDAAAIEKSVSPIKIDGREGLALELYAPDGLPDKAMQVALVEKDGNFWFFKLAGSRYLVKQQKAAFAQFTASVKLKQAPAMAMGPGGAPPLDGAGQANGAGQPDGHPPVDGQAGAQDPMSTQGLPPLTPQATDTKLAYSVPASWTEKPPGSIRAASFELGSGDQRGDVSIVSLAGDGGGLLANANRWRQQLELAPTDQAGLKNTVKDIQVDGHRGYFMALYTGMAGEGMLVALIEQEQQTWFVKMKGPSKLIQSQEKDFQTFVKSIHFLRKGDKT
ncbi:MAG TPA: hypothetical protein V6D23_20310 [Candidatus Obscuribacterales bacterium]